MKDQNVVERVASGISRWIRLPVGQDDDPEKVQCGAVDLENVEDLQLASARDLEFHWLNIKAEAEEERKLQMIARMELGYGGCT